MRGSPFRRLNEFLAAMEIFTLSYNPVEVPPVYVAKAGKGKSRRPRSTGHTHMSYVRQARVRKNRRG